MKLCEQCGKASVALPGSRIWAGSRYCETCLHEKANMIMDVFEVIDYYGVREP